MEWEYKISRIIITVISAVAWLIVTINEDISVRLFGLIVFGGLAVLVSFFGTKVSKKMIELGDKIKHLILRILYYIALFAAIVAIVLIGYTIIENVDISSEESAEFAAVLGRGLMLLVLAIAFGVVVVVPYIQSIIVLILRPIHRLINKKECINTENKKVRKGTNS